jgi:hypothetical protein
LRREEQCQKKPAADDQTSEFPMLLDQSGDVHLILIAAGFQLDFELTIGEAQPGCDEW